jgi:hypothetical protein
MPHGFAGWIERTHSVGDPAPRISSHTIIQRGNFMRRRKLGLSVALACFVATCVFGESAWARVVPGGGDVPPVTDAQAGLFAVRRGVQGPEGLLHSRILLHINTSRDLVGKPISLAPDFYYGVTDSLQIGLLHNLPMGWLTRPGAGICLAGTDNGCPHVYNNVGFDLLYGLLFGDVNLSLHSSFFLLQVADPTPMMLTVGMAGKIHFSRDFAIFFDPQIGLALNQRDNGNEHQVFLPVELQFQLAAPVALKLLTGITGPLSGFSDAYQVPVGLGIIGNVSSSIDLGVRFAFDNLLGKLPPGVERTQSSSLSLLMHIRF